MARYLHESRTLFLHIPRTGGSFIEDAIEVCGVHYGRWLNKQPGWLPRKHALLSHYWPKQHKRISHTVAFVRHPVSLYESWWKWFRTSRRVERNHVKPGKHWDWHPKAQASVHYNEDFNKWVEAMLTHEPSWVTRIYEQYVGPEGGEFCFYIGRTEHLLQCFLEVMGMLGYENLPAEKLNNLNRRNRVKIRINWDRSLQQEVLRTEIVALRRFYGSNSARRLYGHQDFIAETSDNTSCQQIT